MSDKIIITRNFDRVEETDPRYQFRDYVADSKASATKKASAVGWSVSHRRHPCPR